MTWVTFKQDVKPEGDEEAAPLYKLGDMHDVSEKEAKRLIRDGIAERGKHLSVHDREREEDASDKKQAVKPRHATSFTRSMKRKGVD